MIFTLSLFFPLAFCAAKAKPEQESRCDFMRPLMQAKSLSVTEARSPLGGIERQWNLLMPNSRGKYTEDFQGSSYSVNGKYKYFKSEIANEFTKETCSCLRALASSPKAGDFIKKQANKHCSSIFCVAEAAKHFLCDIPGCESLNSFAHNECFFKNSYGQIIDPSKKSLFIRATKANVGTKIEPELDSPLAEE